MSATLAVLLTSCAATIVDAGTRDAGVDCRTNSTCVMNVCVPQ